MIGWLWSVVHNCAVHPLLPAAEAARAFARLVGRLHDATAELAYAGTSAAAFLDDDPLED